MRQAVCGQYVRQWRRDTQARIPQISLASFRDERHDCRRGAAPNPPLARNQKIGSPGAASYGFFAVRIPMKKAGLDDGRKRKRGREGQNGGAAAAKERFS